MRLLRLGVAGLVLAAVPFLAGSTLLAGPDNPLRPSDVKKNEEIEKAEKAFVAGKFDEALKFLQDAEKKDPKLSPARLSLSRYFRLAINGTQDNNQKTQFFQLARVQLERSLVEVPNHPDNYLTLAEIALNESRFTETILACTQALALARGDKWSADRRMEFEKQSHMGLSYAFENRADWESARTHLVALKALDPKSAPILQRLAKALFNLNLPDQCYQELLAANAEDKTLEPAEVTMALLWSQRPDEKGKSENRDTVEKWFGKAIAKNPALNRVHQAYGGWLLDTGNINAAKISINKAKAIDPNSPDTRFLLALMARYERRFDEAEKLFEELNKDQPANFNYSNQLALVLCEQTSSPLQQQRALQIAQVNAERQQRNAEAMATLGWVCFRAGREADADKYLGMSNSLSNGNISPDTAYYIARFLEKKSAKENSEGIRKLLEAAVAQQNAFVHRVDASQLLVNVNRDYPPKKDDGKKDEPKKTP